MKVYQKKFEQLIPASMETVWEFFSSPFNLNKITPPKMNFQILNGIKPEDKMYQGMIINYTVSPLLSIPMRWTTEITHVAEHRYFIDEQRFGPYTFWHHQHHFEKLQEGILMKDILHYALPLGLMGQVGNELFINNEIDKIFAYRTSAVNEIFNNK